jgi:hypothetical protein
MYPYMQKKFNKFKAYGEEQGREMLAREKSGGSAMPEIGDPFSTGNPNGTHAANVRNEAAWNTRLRNLCTVIQDKGDK